MIDNIQITIKNLNIKEWKRKQPFDLIFHISEAGELPNNYKEAFYNDFKFKIVNEKYLLISGSIHKYFNGIKTLASNNYNDFKFDDLVVAIDHFSNSFHISPGDMTLHGIEFGVNLCVPFDSTDFLQNNLLTYKGHSKVSKPFANSGYEARFPFSQYVIKFYNKSAQYNLPNNILRFEYHVKKMENISGSQIRTIEDLLDAKNIKWLGEKLIESFNELLIVDNFEVEKITDLNERELLLQGINPIYWDKIKPNSKNFKSGNQDKNYKSKRKEYYKILERFRSLLEEKKLNTTHRLLASLLAERVDSLIPSNITPSGPESKSKGDKMTVYSSGHFVPEIVTSNMY